MTERFMVYKIRMIPENGDVHIIKHGIFNSKTYILAKKGNFPTSGEYRVLARIKVDIPDKLLINLFDQILKLDEFKFIRSLSTNQVWDNYTHRNTPVLKAYESTNEKYPINIGIRKIGTQPEIIIGAKAGTMGTAAWAEKYRDLADRLRQKLEEGTNILIVQIKREKVIKSLEKTGKVVEKINNGLQTVVTLRIK